MDSLCSKGSRCLLGGFVPLLMSLALSLLLSQLPVTTRSHEKYMGFRTIISWERRNQWWSTGVSSKRDMGTWWEDNPRHNHPRHQPAPRAERLPRSPIPHVPPSFPCTELEHTSSPTRSWCPAQARAGAGDGDGDQGCPAGCCACIWLLGFPLHLYAASSSAAFPFCFETMHVLFFRETKDSKRSGAFF